MFEVNVKNVTDGAGGGGEGREGPARVWGTSSMSTLSNEMYIM